jgi:hypothetical protein
MEAIDHVSRSHSSTEEEMMSSNEAGAEAIADLRYATGGQVWLRGAAIGPLESTAEAVRLASERFAIERLRRRRLASLLERTDQMLIQLEQLNLLEVKRVPDSWPTHLAALVADLPFPHQPPAELGPSPTAAIDAVFDVQAGLLRSMTGIEAQDDEPLEAAS